MSHNFDVFVYALCERVGCTKLFWCHEKTNPRCTRPATVYIDHHYVPSEEKICDKGANSRMYTLVKGSRDLLQEDDEVPRNVN